MMKRAIIIAIILSTPLTAYAMSVGSETEQHATLSDWIFRIINFSVLAGALGFIFHKYLRRFLAYRKVEVESLLKEAEETKQEAKKRLAEIEERVQKKEEEIKAILEDARAKGEKEKELLIEEGRKASERFLNQAKGRIEQELKKAKESLRTEAINLAIELAEKKIKKDLNRQTEDSLVEEYLIKLGEEKF